MIPKLKNAKNKWTPQQVSSKIDATCLRSDATEKDIRQLCSVAKRFEVKSVCLNPCWVKKAKSLLKGSGCRVCTVVGFPLGAQTTKVKVEEIRDSIVNGADEIDVVINIGFFKSGKVKQILSELKSLRKVAEKKVLKIIIEAPLLKIEEIKDASRLVKRAKADFIKTSTGFFGQPVNPEVVRIMRNAVGKNIGIKAAGGIKTWDDACKMLNAGATRIGASSVKKILSREGR